MDISFLLPLSPARPFLLQSIRKDCSYGERARRRRGPASRSGERRTFTGRAFPMHSVYKLPISMAVLQRVDRGELKLDQQVKVEPSDFVRKGMYSPGAR